MPRGSYCLPQTEELKGDMGPPKGKSAFLSQFLVKTNPLAGPDTPHPHPKLSLMSLGGTNFC